MNLKQLLLLIALCVSSVSSFGAGITNINNVTDLFDTHIEDKAALLENIKQQREAGISQIGTKEGFNLIGTEQEANSKASELNAIGETNLENAGRAMRTSEEYRFYDENEYEPDYTKPGNLMHKEDMDMIAACTSNLLSNLLGKLKEIDIDCKTVAGPILKDPVYYIDIKREEQKQTDYDQFFCEEPRNKYTCHDVATLKCNHVTSKPSTIHMTGTNLPVIENRTGYALFGSQNSHWHNGGAGTVYDYHITFNVVSPEHIASFKIGSINYDDWVLIKLNDNYIWSGPRGGTRLDFADPSQPFRWRRVIIDDSGQTYPSENNTWFHQYLNLEMKQYLQQGTNTLSIRLIVGGKGGLLFDLSMADRECHSWIETWDEKCTLN